MRRLNEDRYLGILNSVFVSGTPRTDRTGTGTISLFGLQQRYDLRQSFPLLTTKRVAWKSVVVELLWFLKGQTNIKYLTDQNVTIWNEWADESGELGPVYGKQWRDFNGVDQIKWLVDEIKTNPDSRRLLVSAWNPVDVPNMSLPPCHTMFQVNIEGQWMDLQLYQRSADMFLGVPFNIASYSLLLCILCEATGHKPRHFIHTMGDAHVYSNHIEQVREQLDRGVYRNDFPEQPLCPKINLSGKDIWDLELDDIVLTGYNPLSAIKAPVAV